MVPFEMAWLMLWKWESVAGICSAVRKMKKKNGILGNEQRGMLGAGAVSAEMVHGWADSAQGASDSAMLPNSVASEGMSPADFS